MESLLFEPNVIEYRLSFPQILRHFWRSGVSQFALVAECKLAFSNCRGRMRKGHLTNLKLRSYQAIYHCQSFLIGLGGQEKIGETPANSRLFYQKPVFMLH